uniref:Ig-like domain-containing protein n=1 Tax=Myripristis murdjan TaxID=586833 RepID=A0A667ZGE3_9TELE
EDQRSICVVNFYVLGLFFHRPLALNLKARPGDDVTLICQSPGIIAVEWRRTDLKTPEHVFFYRDRHIDPDYQPPSFKNRVELKDKEMKNGNLSMILKNVKKEDSGTYECCFINDYLKIVDGVIIEDPPISTIRLEVVDPGEFNWDRMTSDLTSVLFHPFPLTLICLLTNLTLSLSLIFCFVVCFRRFRWRRNDSRLCE